MSDKFIRKVKASANTVEAAYAKAQRDIPADAVILGTKEIASPGQKSIIIEAFDEHSARKELESRFKETATIASLKLVTSGSKGFLGLGKKPNQYRAEIDHEAVIEITYETEAYTVAEQKEDESKIVFRHGLPVRKHPDGTISHDVREDEY